MIQLILALLIMTAYLLLVIFKFGWLKSISDSYYHIKHKYIFTFVLWSFAVLMLLGVNDVITTPIYPFACFGIVIVGAYTQFKGSKFIKTMHFVGAISGIALGIIGLWAEFGYMWLTLIYLPLYMIAKFVIKRNNFYWIEVFAIYLIGISLIIILL
jgi:hypothetical protein